MDCECSQFVTPQMVCRTGLTILSESRLERILQTAYVVRQQGLSE